MKRYLAVVDCESSRIMLSGTDKMALKAAEALTPGTAIGYSMESVQEAINDAKRNAAAWNRAQADHGARSWNA